MSPVESGHVATRTLANSTEASGVAGIWADSYKKNPQLSKRSAVPC